MCGLPMVGSTYPLPQFVLLQKLPNIFPLSFFFRLDRKCFCTSYNHNDGTVFQGRGMVSVHILFEPLLLTSTPVKQKCNNTNIISKNCHQSFSVIAITYFPSLFGRTFLSILFEPRCRWSLVRRTKSEAEHSVVGASVAGTLFLSCHPQGFGQTRVSKFKIGFQVWLS